MKDTYRSGNKLFDVTDLLTADFDMRISNNEQMFCNVWPEENSALTPYLAPTFLRPCAVLRTYGMTAKLFFFFLSFLLSFGKSLFCFFYLLKQLFGHSTNNPVRTSTCNKSVNYAEKISCVRRAQDFLSEDIRHEKAIPLFTILE